MNITRPLSLLVATAGFSVPVVSYAQNIDAEREHWVAYSRASEAQRIEAVDALQQLYRETNNPAVRADLIALLIRGGQREEALAICADCMPSELAADELENLAKAARDNKKFDQAAKFYRTLQTRFPDQKIGFLGSALVAADQGRQQQATADIKEYRRRFGDDGDIQAAAEYLNSQTQSQTEQLSILGKRMSAGADKETVLQTYRLAAKMRAYPVQERLIKEFPQYFTQTDKLWGQKNAAASRLRGALEISDQEQLKQAYRELTDIMNATEFGSELHTSALRDRLAASTATGKPEEAVSDYRRLAKLGKQPAYVDAYYAKALTETASPHKASKIYQTAADTEMAQNNKISDELNESLIGAYADLGYYDKARAQILNWPAERTKLDFTRTVHISNPYYNKRYFWNARLDAWGGDINKAIKEMDAWIAEYPADPWAQVLRGELAYWNGHAEEAGMWFNRAQEFLSPESQDWVKSKTASMQMASGNWRKVDQTVQNVSRNNLSYQSFFRDYDQARAPALSINANAMKATSPSEKIEWGQNATLYSQRSDKGHRAYVAEQTAYVPNHGEPLRAGRIGVGAEVSAYPATINIEAGHGVNLDKKAYVKAGVDYRLDSRLSLNANAAYNSADTPTKALNQDVYANEYSIGANYTHSANLRMGIGAGVMDFDDGNLRKTAYAWLSNNLYQYNRWKLSSSLRADYSSNKDIPEAHYYNPKNSKSLSGTLSLSHSQPFDNRIQLQQTVSAGAGRYWQAGENAENTWLLKYGHDWQLGRKLNLSYEVGRRQAIYDGKPEYQNFGSIGLNVKFK
ncbi:poly-beta-1,6 N-acetyl-D-glucosamine export porin PgaA [Neisseria weixii]|uniref:Poly-beta-1,6 N-acetyl-D-glucosamine export porin PgaA n=1 Tax=Neisseria weixii TaxID=1853276 RepID=A0A3N4NJM2_9NEIS|nr:poly-beta-1,6 N-acetyl-D-glucosamine export porin PgaA [Neisseria weixii]RPD87403.1 poly-beta-1,6 N-acetyl-D-glucosamine export porin PgaA [Neisseria weixii]RPD89094.1 poly-beta-1,6 N-acetyl-D-glucosamine export porin PgaA [Neisseria weixii]